MSVLTFIYSFFDYIRYQSIVMKSFLNNFGLTFFGLGRGDEALQFISVMLIPMTTQQINCSKFLHASFCFLSSFLVFSLIKTWPCMYCTSHWPLTSKFIVLMGLYSRAFKLDNWEVQTFFWICQNMIFYLRKAVTVILLK